MTSWPLLSFKEGEKTSPSGEVFEQTRVVFIKSRLDSVFSWDLYKIERNLS